MALSQNTVWEIRNDTGNNSNGGGFNPTNAQVGTDYTYPTSSPIPYSDLSISSIPPPVAPTLTDVTGGGSLSAGTYQVRLTYTCMYSGGETIASPVSSVTVAANDKITVTAPGTGVALQYYNVYMTLAGSGIFYKVGTNIGLTSNYTQSANPSTAGAMLPASPLSNAPPVAPPLSQTSGGALTAGTYKVIVTYATTDGFESMYSPISSLAVTANYVLTVTSPASSVNVTGYNVYMTVAGGSVYYLTASNVAIGTNYSQSSNPVAAKTQPTTANGSTIVLSSVARPFIAADCGNIVQTVASTGSAGFSTGGFYELVQQIGGAGYVDRVIGSPGMVAVSGVLGGAFYDPFPLANVRLSSSTSYLNYIKYGTYNIGGTIGVFTGSIIGYNTTRGDYPQGSARPELTMTVGSPMFPGGQFIGFTASSIMFSGGYPAVTGSSFLSTSMQQTYNIVFDNCKFSDFNNAANLVYFAGTSAFLVFNCEFTNINNSSIVTDSSSFSGSIDSCYFHNNYNSKLINIGSGCTIARCIFANNPSSYPIYNSGTQALIIVGNTFYNNTYSCYSASTSERYVAMVNNVSVSGGGYFFQGIGFSAGYFINNYIYAQVNGFDNYSPINETHYSGFGNVWLSYGNQILTANPLNNPASGDFSINNVAGGGAVIKGASYPTVYPGSSTNNYLDVGAVQSQGGGGSTVIVIEDS